MGVVERVDFSTGRNSLSRAWDHNPWPADPEQMYVKLEAEAEQYPFEMTYSHVSAEEVMRDYWTGIMRDWQKVEIQMFKQEHEIGSQDGRF